MFSFVMSVLTVSTSLYVYRLKTSEYSTQHRTQYSHSIAMYVLLL